MTKFLYSIRDWNDHFECSQSRKIKKALTWVAVPCKHDGKSFRRLMARPDGLEIYATWVLIVQIAAKCPQRGTLCDKDGPLDEADFQLKTGAPKETFTKAIKVLCSKEIGWLVGVEWEPSTILLPLQTGQDKHDQPTNQPDNPPPSSAESVVASDDQADGPVGGGDFSSGWAKVSDRLASLGASRWREAVSEAKSCGCNPGLALTIIDYGKSHNFGVGAIICRLAKARPTMPVESGWPEKPKPVNGTPPPKTADEQENELRFQIIYEGRRSGKSREQVNQELVAAGLKP